MRAGQQTADGTPGREAEDPTPGLLLYPPYLLQLEHRGAHAGAPVHARLIQRGAYAAYADESSVGLQAWTWTVSRTPPHHMPTAQKPPSRACQQAPLPQPVALPVTAEAEEA